jgi:FemAB-related protein (PEP-CTERM system-associated)
VIEESFRQKTWFYYVEQDGQIQGVLSLCQINSRLFGHSLGSLPFCVHGGPACLNDGARAMLDQAAHALALELGVGHLEYRNIVAAHPSNPDWHPKDLYVTFRKEISADDEENMNAIPRKQRAMVRKGIKAGLAGEIDDNVDRMFIAYATSVHRLGTPVFPKKYFALLKEVFGDDCEVRTIVLEGEIIAAVLSFYFRDEVLPYYAGDAVAARDLAANDFKYWELMRRACARGIKVFDYGRSKQGTGSYSFKKNWGFEPKPLHYEYCLYKHDAIPQNNPNNAKYKLLIQTWRRMPIGLANWLGPFLVRSLG